MMRVFFARLSCDVNNPYPCTEQFYEINTVPICCLKILRELAWAWATPSGPRSKKPNITTRKEKHKNSKEGGTQEGPGEIRQKGKETNNYSIANHSTTNYSKALVLAALLALNAALVQITLNQLPYVVFVNVS